MEVIDQRVPALVHMPHPLTSDGRATYIAGFLPDETLGEYFERQGVSLPIGSVSLWCNGIPVPSENWELLIPYEGDRIVVRTALEGGGGGGVGKVLRTVAMIAIAVAAPQLGPMAVAQFGGIGLAASVGATGIMVANGVAMAAIMIGGSMLVNALLPPPKASFNSSAYQTNSQTPTYSITGGQNSARLYEPLLVCVGYNKVIPDLASNPYTEFRDGDQYLFQAFNFGLSDVSLRDFRIGDTLISAFDDVKIEQSGADGKLTMIAGNVDTVSVQDLSSKDGWIQRTTSVNTAAIGIDIVASLFFVNDKGGIDERSVYFQMQYCRTGTGAWEDLIGDARSLTGASQSPIRKTFTFDVPSAQYDVRVRKVTDDVSDTRESNALSWSQMRSYQTDNADYSGQARVAIRIRASAQLSGTISDFSAMAQAYCPVWTGSYWDMQATSNPAWWALWWARGKFINGRRVFGAGLPDNRIDIAGLKEFAKYCDVNGLTCNFVQGAATSIETVLSQIALCGDGSATWLTGKLGIVWDAPNQPPVMQFGPFNIKRDSFQIEYNTQNLADEIVVSFTNPDRDWTTDVVRARAPYVTAASNPVTLDFIGCTSAALAGRKANLLAAGQYYHRRKMTWVSDLEGFVAQRGDVVVLSHDMTAWSYAGRLLAGDRQSVRLDREVPISSKPGYLGIRFPDGTYQVFGVAGGVGTTDSLSLTSPIPSSVVVGGVSMSLPVPDENPDMLPYDWAFFFDPEETPGKRVKVTAVIPQNGGDEVQIIATDEEPQYYAAASGSFDYVPPRTYSHLNGDVQSITFRELLLDGKTGRSRVTVSWVTGAPTTASVAVSINGGAAKQYNVLESSLEIDAFTGDAVSVFVSPRSLVEIKGSSKGMGGQYVVLGLVSALPVPKNVSTVYRDQLTHIIWGLASDPRSIDFEVRIGSTWQTAGVVANTPVPDIVAVGDGMYWIATRYVMPGGATVYSGPATLLVAGASLVRNVLVVRDEAPAWSGTLSGGAVINAGVLTLGGAGNVLVEPNLLAVTNVLELGGIAPTGAYTLSLDHRVNVGRVVPCQLIVASSVHGVRSTDNVLKEVSIFDVKDVLGDALGAAVTARAQIAVAQADGVFGEWRDFFPGIYSGQHFTARMLLTSSDPSIKPVVDEFSFTVDMPDRVDTGTNVPVPLAGLTVTFGSPFNAGPNGEPQPHIQVTLLNAESGDRVVLSAVALGGFAVQVINGASPVARNINWSAQGY